MAPATWGGWVGLGLLTGAGCLVGCGPVVLPYLLSAGPATPGLSLRRLAEFLAGRFAAYLLLFLPALLVGSRALAWPGFTRLSGAATMVLAGLLLAHAYGEVAAGSPWCGLCCRSGRRVPFAAGFALGLAPCAPLLLAMNTLLGAGGLGHGLAYLAGFFAATTFWLLPVLAAGRLGGREAWRGASQVVVVVAGLWFLVRGWCLLTG